MEKSYDGADHPLTPEDRSAIAVRAWDTRGRHEHDARVQRAKRTWKPAKAWKQRWAKKNEAVVAKMVNGTHTDDNHQVDVTLDIDGALQGIEVKTLVANDGDKVTCHPTSCARKRTWATEHHATLHQIVIDDRDKTGTGGWSGWRYYYRRGVGSPRVPGHLIRIRSAAHLKRLLAAPL